MKATPALELRDALQRQAATAEILKVIASSPSDTKPVFDAIAEQSNRLLNGLATAVCSFVGDEAHLMSFTPVSPTADAALKASFPFVLTEVPWGKPVLKGKIFCVADSQRGSIPQRMRDIARARGWRSALFMPLLRGERSIGAIAVTRVAPGIFADHDVELLRTFADQAVIAIENARLFNETRDALARQSAMAEILEVISTSPGDLTPVFDAIIEKAILLCGGGFGALAIHQGGDMHQVVASRGNVPTAFTDMLRPPIHLGPETGLGRLVRGEPFVHILDAADDEGYRRGNPVRVALVDLAGARSYLAIPIRKDGVMLGSFTIYRREVRPFAPELIVVLQSFAAQAAIAIENARLFNETKEALERQTATADILKVIASSPSDVQPVFDAIAESAKRLLGSYTAMVTRVIDGVVHLAASTAQKEAKQTLLPYPLSSDRIHAKVARTGKLVSNADVNAATHLPQDVRDFARAIGWRSMLAVPMLRNGVAIGTVGITRREPGEFDAKTIGLLKTFADQAVIAIENARLFNETKEALAHQTATSDVLQAIGGSMADTQPVFERILDSVERLFDIRQCSVMLSPGDGMLHLAARRGLGTEATDRLFPVPLAETMASTVLDGRQQTYVADAMQGSPIMRRIADAVGDLSAVMTPMIWEGRSIGMVTVSRAPHAAFSEKELGLLRTFADQAVIAIQNSRLFNDTKEALERQTATADILKVIASSPSDVQPVFDAIVANADKLIGGFSTGVYRFADGICHMEAFTPISPAADAVLTARFPRSLSDVPHFEPALAGEIAVVTDTEIEATPSLQAIARARGFRSLLYAPLRSKGTSIGVIAVSRRNPGSFSAHHIELLKTFADQAVIAIENVRLFNETQEALAHQTATSDVLQAIGSSMADTQPVFERILDSVERLFDIRQCSVILARDGLLHLVARRGIDIDDTDRLFPAPMAQTRADDVIRTGQQAYVPSAAASAGGSELMRRVAETMGDYSVVMTPLVWEGQGIGIISAARAPNAVFSDKELSLLRTFADQAVIAIQNARQFNDTREALERQTATADVLKVIASSPSKLDPVFDAIAARSNELIHGHATTVFRFIGDEVALAAFTPVSDEADAVLRGAFPRLRSNMPAMQRVFRGETAETVDTEAADAAGRDVARARGFRSRLVVPLVGDGGAIGAISVTRKQPGKFADKDIDLLRTFADQAVIAIQNVELFEEVQARTRDLSESLEQQTATAEILSSISGSMNDTRPVFEAIVRNLLRLFGTRFAVVQTLNDGIIDMAAADGQPGFERIVENYPRPLADDTVGGLAMLAKRTVQFHPVLDNPAAPPTTQDYARSFGFDAVLFTPMMSGDKVVGSIGVAKHEAVPFDDKQITLISAFANQAAIAIENTRLLRELRERTDDLSESLQQQTATADVLKVISRSAFDLSTVMNTLAHSARTLCGSKTAALFLRDGDMLVRRGATIDGWVGEELLNVPVPLNDRSNMGRAVLTGKIANVGDLENSDTNVRTFQKVLGFKAFLGVPLMREGRGVGVFTLTKDELGPFSQRQVDLVQTFADQAVIAIENVRLFNETQEALERQTATADILKVIASSPSDVQPVFEAIAERANKLAGGYAATVLRVVGDNMDLAAFTSVSKESDATLQAAFPIPIAGNFQFEAMLRGEIIQIADTESEQYAHLPIRNLARARGFRSRLLVPLKTDSGAIGAISVTRVEPGVFSDHHVQLLQTFAAQAVIAIQNVRLFKETQEALERQTATADILKVIASSPDDVQPVFEAIAERSNRIVEGRSTAVYSLTDGVLQLMAFTPTTPEADAALRAMFPRQLSWFRWGEAISRGEVYQVPDMQDPSTPAEGRELAVQRGFRALMVVPLMSERKIIGVISVTRATPGIFADHHVRLLQTFADQAVIAIQNVRLFKETQEALERQTATADILKVIASSPDDVQPVFEAIAERSNRIVEGRTTAVYSLVDGIANLMAFTPTTPEGDAALRAFFPRPLAQTSWGEAIGRGEIHEIPDVQASSIPRGAKELAERRGYCSLLFVPLLSEGKTIGAISVTRSAPGKFADHHLKLLQTFADQAVIAISNVDLFLEVQQRTRDLSQSLDDLRAAQGRLVQTEKLASLGQLTAGIAHEIKNPLNFVNNFAALSAELTGELNDLLKDAALTGKMRDEVTELTRLLQGNLEKVVQHGKRADSIVKNMLLHSREGSGEQRAADINALVDESLNLAYHGARAEKSGFNITLQRDFDASAGSVELFPQEITRALLNLISNGFYAATKRQRENGGEGFEPVLRAETKDLGSTVEIRIRDNGTGIPPEVREKMFNPFFTTKPAGEGTGLGLSMTHDIIVKQHGGRIEVATTPGQFTEFTIVLPRTSGAGGRESS